MASEQPPRRVLGRWGALALVVGNMIGSGIFLLPATLAPLGDNALIGWLITIGGAMALAYVFARLAARVPCAGGPYAFADAAFGPVVGFCVAWSYWSLLWTGNGAIAVGIVSALSVPVPALGEGWPALATSLAFIWVLVLINIRGVALASDVQLVTTAIKLVPLAGVLIVALWLLLRDGDGALVANPPVPLAAGAVASAAALTFWGFLGVESATVPADKVADPTRTIPFATLLGTGVTGIVYLLVALAIAGMLPTAETARSPAPVADFLGQALGSGVGTVVAICAAVSAFGALNGFTLLQGEMPWAMARGGVFPAWFGKEGTTGTPVRAHLLCGGLVTALMVLNYTGTSGQLFQDIISISLATGMLAYIVCPLAALKLLPRGPGLVIAALVSVVFVVWMTYGLGWKPNLWGLGLLLLGLPVYWSVRRRP